MANNSIFWLVSVLALLVGVVIGAMWFSTHTEVDVPFPVPSAPKVEYLTQNISVPVADATLYVKNAQKDLLVEIGDEDDFLTCDGYTYDENEVSVTDIRDWTYHWVDEDEYEVTFEAKFKFDDNSEERACKETRAYSLTYEDGEDVVVELIE